jgi:hypothetical protein
MHTHEKTAADIRVPAVITLLCFLAICPMTVRGQCPPAGDIVLSTQAEVNSFIAAYPTCAVIDGSLQIGQLFSDSDIVNLSGLSALTGIGGNLTISHNIALPSLNGLNGIAGIGGNLTISNNENITDFSGLGELGSIGGSLTVSGNYKLANLNGLGKLTGIGGQVLIEYCASLLSIAALSGISSVPGNFILQWNPEIASVEGLNNLASIGGNLHLVSNQKLSDISVLSALKYIQNDLYIQGSALANLNGLQNLATIGRHLQITSNSTLLHIRHLSGLNSIGGMLTINGNASLADLRGLEGVTALGGYININTNISLVNLSGLDNLAGINGNFTMYGNTSLNSIAALGNLGGNLGSVYIINNPALASLGPLSGVSAIQGSTLRIKTNALLEFCSVPAVCNYLEASVGTIDIDANLANCNTKPAILNLCGTTLPVQWLSFTVKAERGHNELYWQTASELNNEGFEVQGSRTGMDFAVLGFVPGAGTSQAVQSYRFPDHRPISGRMYYCLRQIDFDGTEAYSPVVMSDSPFAAPETGLYPNPADQRACFSEQLSGIQLVRILAHNGREVMRVDKPGSCLDIAHLPAGIYLVRISTSAGEHQTRLVKK